MAEEAFALSPISARASLPSEADYEAIREAFMETARGRWFLSEYTKRNRNTDTSLVLEAVARMEANLAAQKQASVALSLIEALGAIRSAIRDAKVVAAEAMPLIEDNETLAAARDGARIIREIAWTLRECGADTRICDLLDTHIKAIESGQRLIATGDSRSAVLASYDTLVQRIELLATSQTKPAVARAAPPAEAAQSEQVADSVAEKREASITPLFRAPPEPAEQAETSAISDAIRAKPETSVPKTLATETSAAETSAAAIRARATETPASASIARENMATALAEIMLGTSDEAVIAGAVAAGAAAAQSAAVSAEEAEDLAVLDMVAMEMAVPDPSEPERDELEAAALDVAAPNIAPAFASESSVDKTSAGESPAEALKAMVAAEPQAAVVRPPSLGAALIANGLVSNPAMPKADPLAAIRRMSQIEKIAFFS